MAGRETQHLLPVNHGLAKAEGNLCYTFLRLLISNRIEIQGACRARDGREIIAVVFGAANFLQDYTHFLFGDNVGRGRYVSSRRSIIHRCIDALNSIAKKAELLVFILGAGYHIGRINPRKRLIIRIFQLRGRAHGKRLVYLPDKHPQGSHQLGGKGGRHELGKEFAVRKVGVYYILKAVLKDKTVEEIGGDGKCPRHQHAHILPLVIQVVLVEYVAQEGQSAGLAAQRAFAQTGKANSVVVSVGIETGHHSESLSHTVVVNTAHYIFAQRRRIRINRVFDLLANGEDAPCKQPAGNIVLGLKCRKIVVGNRGYNVFRPLEVGGPRNLVQILIRHHKIAETEFPADVLAKLMGKHLGLLMEESGAQSLSHAAHALLRGLHEYRHLGNLAANLAAEVNTGIQFLALRSVAFMPYESDIGYDAEQLVFISFEKRNGIVIIRCEQYFRARPLAENLLVFVECIVECGYILLQHQFVQEGKVGRVITHRVLYQQDALHSPFQYVRIGVQAVFQQLDNGQDQIGGAAPAEGVVDMAAVLLTHLAPYLPGIGRQKHNGRFGADGLHLLREIEHIHLSRIIHGYYEVEALSPFGLFESAGGGLRPFEHRRIGQVKLRVFP